MRKLTVCLLNLSALGMSVVPHAATTVGRVSHVRQDQGMPCYVVISNDVREDSQLREIRILMDKADVTEANFIKLHRHFSGMYPDVKDFSVKVNTSLNFTLGNYTTVEDVERQQVGLPRKPKVWEKDAQGILIRKGKMEKFGYKAEGGALRDMKYILVKGEDPDCDECKRLESDVDREEPGIAPHEKSTEHLPCYFVIGNSVTNGARLIGVFINAEDGNEPNLLALLRHFSRQHPEAETLVIKAYTNFEQRNDFAVPVLGDLFVPAMRKHFVAALFRDSRNEVMRYRRPHGEVTTVVVRGVDIFPGLDSH